MKSNVESRYFENYLLISSIISNNKMEDELASTTVTKQIIFHSYLNI